MDSMQDVEYLKELKSKKNIKRIDFLNIVPLIPIEMIPKEAELRITNSSVNLDDLIKVTAHYPKHILSICLSGEYNLVEAINFLTALDIPLTVDIISLLKCDEITFDKICSHFFYSKLLKVPIEPFSSFVLWASSKNKTELSCIYGDKFGYNYYINKDGDIFLSKSDRLNRCNSVGGFQTPHELIIGSKEFREKQNFENELFSKFTQCATCTVYGFCRGYILSYEDERQLDICNTFIYRVHKIKAIVNELLKSINDERQRNLDKISAIQRASIFVTFRCVNDCIFCAASGARESGIKKEKKEIIESIKKIASKGVQNLSLSGAGEPTLEDELENYVSIAKVSGIKEIIIFTNGYGLTNNRVVTLRDLGLSGALVSLHGLESSHDVTVQRKGSFQEAINAIGYFINNDMTCTVNTCLTKINMNEIESIIKIVEDLGVKKHSLSFPEWSGKSCMFDEQMISYAECKEVLRNINFSKYPSVLLDNVPFCVASSKIQRVLNRDILSIEKNKEMHIFSDSGCNYIPEICRITNCPYINQCVGIDKTYLNLRGDSELFNLRAELSFSFPNEMKSI